MYQKIILVGNLGKDPEMRYTPSGDAICNFSLATNRHYKRNDGEDVSETTWWRVSVWGKQGEACNTYLKKGSKALVEGRMVVDIQTGGPKIWNRQDGTPAASFEITAETVRFLSSKSESSSGHPAPVVNEDEDIPF